MDSQKRIELIESVGEEIVTRQELETLVESGKKLSAYDGFEPSGLAHLPFAVYRAQNVKRMVEAKVEFILYLADYFAFVNNKMNADMGKIRACGKYFCEVWKAAGIPMDKVKVVWASELMDSLDYWDTVLRVARNITLNRTRRAMLIAGREETEKLTTAQMYYPSMQVADIFMLGVDICQLGMDQRRANMLAREVAEKLGKKKPVAVHHHMLLGLQGAKEGDGLVETKMSKSKPDSSIFVHDSAAEIERKIMSAYCPAKTAEDNPVLEYCSYVVFPSLGEIEVKRDRKYGGNVKFSSYQELEKAYVSGKLHPLDLKKAVASGVEELIAPIRRHFEREGKARKLYLEVKEAEKTR